MLVREALRAHLGQAAQAAMERDEGRELIAPPQARGLRALALAMGQDLARDHPELAARLGRIAGELGLVREALIQVNSGDDPAKFGCDLAAAPAVDPVAKSRDAGRDTLSVDFPDEDIRTILRNVADLFELNIVMPEALRGKTTVKLRDVTWRQIFENILRQPNGSRSLSSPLTGNLIQ